MIKLNYKIIHLITGLNTGGAEMMLYKLLSRINHNKFDIYVISLMDVGPIGKKIKELGIPVMGLGMKRGVPNPYFLFKLTKVLRSKKPHILQTWMYHSDLIGFLAGRIAGIKRIVWNIRHSNLDPCSNKHLTLKIAQMCAILSRFVNKIICCSESSFKAHNKIGYMSEKMVVIPNGFDLDKFSPNDSAKSSLRAMLSIPKSHFIVGMVARWDPLKDHYTFIRAAKFVINSLPNVHFVLCGDLITQKNEKLLSWIKEQELEDHFHLLGRRDDIERIMPAFDLLVSSSKGEAFPNVLGEAMACEVPCVVTDVGDSAFIVGNTGYVVPPDEPELLAKDIIKFLNLSNGEKGRLGNQARNRVEENFSLDSIVRMYEQIYIDLLEK